MNKPGKIKVFQNPPPESPVMDFCGNTITLTLEGDKPLDGTAMVRTNIGYGKVKRLEIMREVDLNDPPLGRDWFDFPMGRVSDRCFSVTLPLFEVGHFEAKCYFLHGGRGNPVWPEGGNIIINVEPAGTVCGNIIYNAFIRQFGDLGTSGQGDVADSELARLDRKGFTVIPPSGKIRDFIKQLDFIIDNLGCRIIHLLPIHPVPTTHARMGRFGSPYAALNFTDIDPHLAVFDPRKTHVEQFIELVDEVHRREGLLFMDIAINHTGWAALIHETHPEWLLREPDGSIEVPGAWGVTWADLTRLDYGRTDLWKYMAEIFLLWCRRGVDGFRCDAGYMIPTQAWRYIVACVREQFPDTVFFLEGLGGPLETTQKLLESGNLNWAYSELFQNYTRGEIEGYLSYALDVSESRGLMVHFAETHDNNRLAGTSITYASMRTALCALSSVCGGFGFAAGVEWFATEKIDVHGSSSLNWGDRVNQVERIGTISRILKFHPAFHPGAEITICDSGSEYILLIRRRPASGGATVYVVVNLDCSVSRGLIFTGDMLEFGDKEFTDLLSGERVTGEHQAEGCFMELSPGRVLCLSEKPHDLVSADGRTPDLLLIQHVKQKVLQIFHFYGGLRDMAGEDLDLLSREFLKDPLEFVRGRHGDTLESRVVVFRWPEDLKRLVMVPPGFMLLLMLPARSAGRISHKETVYGFEKSLKTQGGDHVMIFPFDGGKVRGKVLKLSITAFFPEKIRHGEGHVMWLSADGSCRVRQLFGRNDVITRKLSLLLTGGNGAMSYVNAAFGETRSRYDSVVSANLNPSFPENRWNMFARIRAWVEYQGFSQEVSTKCLVRFGSLEGSFGYWSFNCPTGQGEHAVIMVGMEMVRGGNGIRVFFYRNPSSGIRGRLSDECPVTLVIRPDIENRSFHETTKAFLGPEKSFPEGLFCGERDFRFAPGERSLQVTGSSGAFVREPEWQYMVFRENDAQRGQDPNSDLFSPGYFKVPLAGGESFEMAASISMGKEGKPLIPRREIPGIDTFSGGELYSESLAQALRAAMDSFLVTRGDHLSVIAGYPWFLDWGRDSLIFVRGLIADGRFMEARQILHLFGKFEAGGTLPNMICGDDAGNRDTSDAPLWFVIACRDLTLAENSNAFLSESLGGKTVRETLLSIVKNYMEGTENGIIMDPESCLIYSPSHFTWMDTNFPAGTPRQGYCIEIQALWYGALMFLESIDRREVSVSWKRLADNVRESVETLFWREDKGYLSDCLHASPGDAARSAHADDALRPNQLFSVTMGLLPSGPMCRSVLESCMSLLVPGGIRSLADRTVDYPMEIQYNGKTINNPTHPYYGEYGGDEDTRRKPAYHNGTAWTWVFPSFCEAWKICFGERSSGSVKAWLRTCTSLMERGVAGHLPEITDGDYPHSHRGCGAQAWGVSEFFRVWLQVSDE